MLKIKVLLVEPDFPFPNKSKNQANSVHKNFVPISLLKLGALYKDKGNKVKLIRGNKTKKEIGFKPDEILVTSIFTYWSSQVWDSVKHYRGLFPKSNIKLGGIYATLHSNTKKFQELAKQYNVKPFIGLNEEAEKYLPDYSLLPDVDYHATHMMRGCIRKCKFCGTWMLEPELTYKNKEKIIEELKAIGKNKVIFYDNNLLANPNIKEILEELTKLKIKGKPVVFEAQSGFDGRLLEKNQELAELLKKARFQNIRIAWDNSLNDKNSIKKQIDLLTKAGFSAKDIFIFMIYNWDIPFEEMQKKIKICRNWGVQICDCRYRPLSQLFDEYNPQAYRKGQTEEDYYIHKKAGWTDKKVRKFRMDVRKQNIGIRYGKNKEYNHELATTYSNIKRLYKKAGIKKVPKLWKIKRSKKIQKQIQSLKQKVRSLSSG